MKCVQVELIPTPGGLATMPAILARVKRGEPTAFVSPHISYEAIREYLEGELDCQVYEGRHSYSGRLPGITVDVSLAEYGVLIGQYVNPYLQLKGAGGHLGGWDSHTDLPHSSDDTYSNPVPYVEYRWCPPVQQGEHWTTVVQLGWTKPREWHFPSEQAALEGVNRG